MNTQAPQPETHKPKVSPAPHRKRRRYLRAFWMLLRHMTFRRLTNMMVVEFERMLGRATLHGYPYIITIDPTNYCNLRCPLCPTGNGTLGRSQGMLSLADFQHLVDQASPRAFEISLMNWGEPLLNPDLFEMIRFCHSKHLSISISTNLARLKPQDVDQLLASGLDYMTVSIDGTTQEVYSVYRVGGKLDSVLSNLRVLIARRAELGLKSPWIRWQFIIMKHNEHQMEDAKRLAAEIGVDEITFIPVGLPAMASKEDKVAMASQWFATQPQYRQWDPENPPVANRGGRCPYLYRTMVINPDGGVSPCCIVYGSESQDYGNLLRSELGPIWNNPCYVSARLVQTGQGEGSVPTVCHGCSLYARDKGVIAGIRYLLSM
jgi:MoaA/NifB/PqqE/SkfB family radical SAM enzyme